jgi:acyl-coenzyme A synthetase/AMP-(fatty) acid ligase/3-hydroxymyristoyl/3-hydroxydecanoyl-(acyl carrier protein) dehydratase
MIGGGVGTGADLSLAERGSEVPFALGSVHRTWGDLMADAGAVARHLRRGEGPDSSEREVMVACTDRYRSAVSLLAVWHAGRVAGLPPNGRPETIDALCHARGIRRILHDGGGAGGVQAVDVRTIIAQPGEPLPAPKFPPARVLVCVFTSGSTGQHVAYDKTAQQILGEARLLSDLFALGPGTRLLATVPPHHIYGLLFGVLVPLMGGGAVLRLTPHHAETIADHAKRWGANVLVSVPAHLHGLAVLPPDSLPRFTRVFSSGGPLSEATAGQAAHLLGTAITEVFGASETGGIAWRQVGGQKETETGVATPRPTDGQARDEGGGHKPWQPFPGIRVESEPDGRIIIHSPFVPRHDGSGDEVPSFAGADRIALHADGRFDLLGRADGVVKIGGNRTSIAEVEQRLLAIAGVRDAVVISVDVAGPRRHELWAAVAASHLSVSQIRTTLLHALDPIAIPRRFRIVEALPRESNGKLVRRRLLDLFAAAAPGSTNPVVMGGAAEFVRDEVHFPPDSRCFLGHFDGFPVVPGVVQVNDLVLRRIRAAWPGLRHLRRIVALKFRSPIRPGDTVAVEIRRSASSRVVFQIQRSGGTVSSGTLVFEPDPADA